MDNPDAKNGYKLVWAAYNVPGPDEHERSALVLLAVMANGEGVAWPGVPYMVEKTGQSERTLQRAIRRLVEAGHIERRQRRHDTAIYIVHPRSDPKPVTVTGVTLTGDQLTPVRDGVNTRHSDTLITKNNQDNIGGVRARGTRLPVNWEPAPLPGSVVSLVTLWPQGRERRELDNFRDYWIARPDNATKLDWDATWRSWLRRQHEQIMKEARRGPRNHTSSATAGGAGGRPGEVDAALSDLGISRSQIYQ